MAAAAPHKIEMPANDPSNGALQPVRVWDLPTRLFHWLLALVVISAVVSGYLDALEWHMRFGLVACGLLIFRIVWGFVGGRWSRFASFAYGPATVKRYLRGESRPDEHHDVGHNPMGSFSVFALLALLVVQVATGLVADDEVSTTGPLNKFVANATAQKATSWHHEVGQWLIVLLVVLHIGAIVFYKVKKQKNLVPPMLNGDKLLPPGTPASADGLASRLLALVLFVLAFGVVGWIWKLGA